jgi:nicotinate phosphoribosyltransferase
LTALSKSIRRILDVGGLANVAIFASGGAYKLAEYAGLPRRKRSTGKASWPGRKQVWRRYGPDGRMSGEARFFVGCWKFKMGCLKFTDACAGSSAAG